MPLLVPLPVPLPMPLLACNLLFILVQSAPDDQTKRTMISVVHDSKLQACFLSHSSVDPGEITSVTQMISPLTLIKCLSTVSTFIIRGPHTFAMFMTSDWAIVCGPNFHQLL